jgi:hypothetical protein
MMISKTRSNLIKILLLVSFLLPTFTSGAGLVMADTAPPVLDLNGEATGVDYNAIFAEDEGYKAIVSTTGLTILNGDDDVLTGASAFLTNPLDGNLESLTADPGATGLNVTYAADKSTLTIKGNGSVANYQQVLRTLAYNNLSQSPDTTDRVVSVTVSDGQMISETASSYIAINAVNDAPMLDNSGDMTMTPINEDDPPSNGNSVTGIIKTAEMQGQDRITDVDKNSLEGFAVVEAAPSNGVWQYYSANISPNWQPFVNVSNTSAVLLNGEARIRFVPNPNFSGSASFLFRAWDQSGGRASGTTSVDVSVNGGITPYSTATEIVTIIVNPVNDAPIVDLNGSLPGVDCTVIFFEGGAPVAIAESSATITDVDHTQLAKLTVTLTNRPDGTAESLTTDVSGTNILPIAYDPTTGMLILNGPDSIDNFQTVLRRITYANTNGTPTTAARAVTVVANDGVADGLPATSLISVKPPNSAPVLDPAAILTLNPVMEDTTQPAGEAIVQILASGGDPITDADEAALEGIAVIGVDPTGGQWQYSLVAPPVSEVDWLPVGVVSSTNALLLSDASWLRFVPAADFSGQSGAVTFRAWDRTGGSNGQRADVSINGGVTAFSVMTNTLNVMVTAVNDLPLLGGLPTEPLLYVEDAAPLPLAGASLTMIDVDSLLLTSATVRLTNPLDGDAEWLLATTNGTGIIATFEDGVLRLTGNASPAAYQTVLRSVKYWNASQDPDPADRVFQLSVADNQGSRAPSTLIVQVQPVNDPPELDLNGSGSGEDYATTFYLGRGPVSIVADSMTLSDVDNTTIKSATIRIVNLQNGQMEILSADVSGVSNITSRYDQATGLLMLTGGDSVANYARVLRTITYDNASSLPTGMTRTVEFILNDGTGPSEPRRTMISFAEAAEVYLFMPMVSRPAIRAEEPNDSCVDAFGLSLNEEQPFRPDDKDDWFFFETTQPSELTVELRDFSPGAGQIVVASGQSCGGLKFIGNNGSSTPIKIVSLGQRPAGRYFIWIINDGVFDANSAYRLHVRSTP